jgi:hypothetical protein
MKRLKGIILADLVAAVTYGCICLLIRIGNAEVVASNRDVPAILHFVVGFVLMLIIALPMVALAMAMNNMENGGRRVARYVAVGLALAASIGFLAGWIASYSVPLRPARPERNMSAWQATFSEFTLAGMLVLPLLSLFISLPLAVRRESSFVRERQETAERDARKRFIERRAAWEQEQNAPRCPFCGTPVAANGKEADPPTPIAHCSKCGNWLDFVVASEKEATSSARSRA